MEGKATFTLTEAKTGRIVSQVTEHNMVTDAVKRILNPPAYTLLNKFSYSDFIKNVLPLYDQLFGGIMLLGNELEERADNVMPGKDIRIVATAGDAYSGTNVCRGTRNDNECYPMENGYHFTWDFPTDKANGTIKCAALTSRTFGNTGALEGNRDGVILMDPVAMGVGTGFTIQAGNSYGRYVGTFQKKTHTYFYYANNAWKTLAFTRVKCLDPAAVGINDSAGLTAKQEPASTVEVTMPFTVSNVTKPFYDPKKNCLYFYSTVHSTDDGYGIDYAGISMDDFSIIDQGTYGLAQYYGYVFTAAFHNGKFFIATYNGVDIYSAPGVIESTPITGQHNESNFSYLNGVLMYRMDMYNAYLYLDSGFFWVYTPASLVPCPAVDVQLPYVMMCQPYSDPTVSTSVNPFLGLASCYFATINNLSQPLVKTSEHTLKITYDITN